MEFLQENWAGILVMGLVCAGAICGGIAVYRLLSKLGL